MSQLIAGFWSWDTLIGLLFVGGFLLLFALLTNGQGGGGGGAAPPDY